MTLDEKLRRLKRHLLRRRAGCGRRRIKPRMYAILGFFFYKLGFHG